MHVHLLVPDLCHPELLAPDVSGTKIQLASAEILVARGRRSLAPTATGTESWLKARFEVDSPDDSGLAAWSLLGDGLAPGDSAWLRADPVHLRVNRDALMLADATLFGISSEEAEALIGHLNRHLPRPRSSCPFIPGAGTPRPMEPPCRTARHRHRHADVQYRHTCLQA